MAMQKFDSLHSMCEVMSTLDKQELIEMKNKITNNSVVKSTENVSWYDTYNHPILGERVIIKVKTKTDCITDPVDVDWFELNSSNLKYIFNDSALCEVL